MIWLLFAGAALVFSFEALGQDIVFPKEEEISHLSGTKPITERIPVHIPGRCPLNMVLYPGDGNSSVWECDCTIRHLYFPLNDTCHPAYRQGPCAPKNYVVLPKNETVPKCVENPCLEDGWVQYNNTCYQLEKPGEPCVHPRYLNVNETTFEIQCVDTSSVPNIIIDAPTRCPSGSRRNALGKCKKMI